MFIDTGCPNVDYPAMCTARAKDAPFVLSYNSHRDRDGPTQTQKHDLVVNFSRAYAVCLTLEENDLVQTLLQIPAPRLNTLQIETHVMHKIPPALSALSHQLVELTFWDVDLRGCPSYAWPVMRRLRLQHTILTPDSLCSMVFQMPLLEHLVIRSIEGLDDEHVSNKLDTSPRNQHALHNLHTIFFQMRPAACVSLLKVLHSSVHSCQKLDVDFLNAYEGDGTFVSGDTMVEALEHIMLVWGHLFVGPFLPVTLAVEHGRWQDDRHSFTLVSSLRDSNNLQHSSITIEYLLDFRHRYQTLGITFGAIELIISSEPSYLNLTELCNVHAPNAVKLNFRRPWDLTGLSAWLAERKATTLSCTIMTVEITQYPDHVYHEEVNEEIERLRRIGIVEVVISFDDWKDMYT
jgi:hypothetical protein